MISADARVDLAPRSEVEERRRYAQYRQRQARALVGMLPKAAVRPLYRQALAEGFEISPEDPLGTLAAFCEGRVLPLPPFDVWQRDAAAHPDAHLAAVDQAADAPTAEAPATLEARFVVRRDGAWRAKLRGFRDREGWRGFIAFEDGLTGETHNTALIFREADPLDLRDRFLSFTPHTLEAFLRSALP